MSKIVVCEDDDLICKLVQIILRDLPHALYFASNGLDGLALIERERPGLIFTDQNMDGLDGFKLCAELKAREHLAHIPVILVSGEALNEDQCANGPFAAVLRKPFHTNTLHTKVEELLPA